MSEDIEKKREIFAKTLDKIGITRESLLKQPHLVQCKYNSHHYVPESSLDRHLRTCPYSALKMDKKTIELYLDQLDYKYTDSPGIIGIPLDSSTLRAIRDYCRHGNSGGSHDVEHKGQDVVLESNQDVPSDIIQQNDPILLIRYIKSINQVPLKYHTLIPSLYHPILLKTWLISNIPQQHIYKGEIGGEFHLVDDMLYYFTVSPTVTPTTFLHRVHPLISHASRHFTMSFWKFLIIHQIQQHHNISEKLVQDLLPLPNMDVKSSNDKDVSSVIKSMAARIPCEQHVPIPVQHVSMTTNEKRLLYDYVVEVSRKERREANNASAFTNDISSLYNDSIKMTGGNVKGLDGEGKDKLLELKEMRDVKRRRQSYRAKNVHITQKSIKQVFRDIIAARTEDLKMMCEQKHEDENTRKINETDTLDNDDDKRKGFNDKSKKRSRSKERKRSRSKERKRSRSKERKRSRSKERKRSRSKERKRSLSKERKRSRSKERKRSLSKERKRSRSKERKRSRSKERKRSQSKERSKKRKTN